MVPSQGYQLGLMASTTCLPRTVTASWPACSAMTLLTSRPALSVNADAAGTCAGSRSEVKVSVSSGPAADAGSVPASAGLPGSVGPRLVTVWLERFTAAFGVPVSPESRVSWILFVPAV